MQTLSETAKILITAMSAAALAVAVWWIITLAIA
jgi:cell division protein FtsL